jgi:Holliday junction resolvase
MSTEACTGEKRGRYSRNKGTRAERELVRLLPDAERVGKAFVKSLIDITWNKGKDVGQVKNTSYIGGTAIAQILEELERVAPDSRKWVLIKPKRGSWVMCQTLKQYLASL